jgi:hypothetical protein
LVPYYSVTQIDGTNLLDFIHARRTNAVVLGLTYYLELTDDPIIGTWTNRGYLITGTETLGDGFDSVTNRVDEWASTNLYIRLAIESASNVVYSSITEITPLAMWLGGFGLSGTNALPGADVDADGLDNAAEFIAGADPLNADSDSDSMPDGWEVSYGFDPLLNDAAGDADADELSNVSEYVVGTDPVESDTDDDALPDGWEVEFALNPLSTNALADADDDGCKDLCEFALGGDPTNGSNVGQIPEYFVTQIGGTNWLDYLHVRRTNAAVLGLSYEVELSSDPESGTWTNSGYTILGTNDLGSGFELVTNGIYFLVQTNLHLRLAIGSSNDVVYSGIMEITPLGIWAGGYGLYGTNALPTADTDVDGLLNGAEFAAGTDPLNADSDADGLLDGQEIHNYSTNPLLQDSDFDGLDDGEEVQTYSTNPLNVDTDGDTFLDGLEVANAGNPLVSDAWRVSYIRSHGEEYDLFSSNAVLDIAMGQAVLQISNGVAWLSLQLEQSNDLLTWTNAGDEVIWNIPVDSSNAFYRVRSER